MKQEILISGFGGQGLMVLGKILARAALSEDRYTVWFPSYGAEMRGGTAHCFIKISDSPIASPFIDCPDIAIIFNQPSLDKFKKRFKKKSLLILNSDLISSKLSCGNIRVIKLPFNQIAIDCGNIKAANIAALGALIFLKPGLFKKKTLFKVLGETFKDKDILAQNLKALGEAEALLSGQRRKTGC